MTGRLRVKRTVSSLLSRVGIHALAERAVCSGKAFVLMYHRILTCAADQPYFVQPGMYVAAASFDRQLAFLKDRFKIVFLEDLVEMLLKGQAVGGYCAITFDDGWRDNYTDAFPMLQKYHVPATIFLATGFIGTGRMFWPEELCCYLARGAEGRRQAANAPASYMRFNEEIEHLDERDFDGAIEIVKAFSPGQREELLGYLRGLYVRDPLPRQMLSWAEAREMCASGLVRFGAHTVNHEILDQVTCQKAQAEIFDSCEEIEHQLGSKVTTFAYPNGNHSASIRKALAGNGLKAAVTTHKGFLDHNMPLMELPRIGIHEDVSNTIPLFRSRILFHRF